MPKECPLTVAPILRFEASLTGPAIQESLEYEDKAVLGLGIDTDKFSFAC